MSRHDNTTVEIDVKVLVVTPLALKIDDGKTQAWIPRSQILDYTPAGAQMGYEVESIFIPLWLATEKGLV